MTTKQKIFSKRNAVLGWAAWKVGKGMFKKKSKAMLHGKSHSGGGKKKVGLIAGIGAALGGLALLKRKRKSSSEPSE